jgi:hypothetical protein
MKPMGRGGNRAPNFTVQLPWGYRSSKGRLEPTEDAAPKIQTIFDLAAEGKQPEAIAHEVDVDELPADRIRSILQDPAYAGVWLTVGDLKPAVSPARWVEAQQAVGGVDKTQATFVEMFGSAPTTG